MSNDSVQGGWSCVGRVVPPSVPRPLSRAEIAGRARMEQQYERLYDMADGPTAGYWQKMLAALDTPDAA